MHVCGDDEELIKLFLNGYSQVGNFMHYISRFLAGFIIGFVRVWQISLVTLSIVPLIALAGGIYAYIATGLIARVRKSYVKAGEIAEEVTLLLLLSSLLFDKEYQRLFYSLDDGLY